MVRAAAISAVHLAAFLMAACGAGGGGGNERSISQDMAIIETPGLTARDSNPGDFAADYLRGKHFRSLVVEVDYAEGMAPTPAALELLRERLAERCDKPEGVSIVLDDEIPASEFAPVLGDAELVGLEEAHRTFGPDAKNGVASIYVLCAPGESDESTKDERVIGLSYTGSSLVLFVDVTDMGTNVWVTTEEVQGTILVHETGHLLGLTNHGVPMVNAHEDLDHPHHDVDPSSVMYYAPRVPRQSPNIGDPTFASYGAECILDVQAFGGK